MSFNILKSWGEEILKRRKNNTGVSKTRFDELADDMMIEIFRRLDIKDRAKLKCVSKPWRRLIDASCFPKYAGFLYKYEDIKKPRGEVFHLSYSYKSTVGRTLIHCRFFLGSIGLSFVLNQELQESCNGLLLLCHYECSHGFGYNYYVVNPWTKQYVKIAKPKQNSGSYKYAALAYHPAESSFFKIVRFRLKHLDVYSSETGKWISSRIQLRENVLRAKWVKQSVYFEGSIYRLSMSGHILRFLEERKKTTKESWVVEEIEIPGTVKIISEEAWIGLSNGKIKFAIRDGLSLKIWELNNKFIDFGNYQQGSSWSLRFSCPWEEIIRNISPARQQPRLLTFHPDLDAIIVGYVDDHKETTFRSFSYSQKMTKMGQLESPIRSRYGKSHKSVFPLLACEACFAISSAT